MTEGLEILPNEKPNENWYGLEAGTVLAERYRVERLISRGGMGAVFEATTQMLLNRFVLGRYAQPHLSCWEHECQAGRIYVAMNLNGDVFSCGTDMMSHRLGHVDEGFSKAHVNQTLCQLHKKDAWYVRCFNCSAKKICSMSCPTSDHNNINYREAECEYTRRIYQYFQENEAEVQRVHRIIGEKRPVQGHALR